MSTNRENITWQSKDGTWNLGFLSFRYVDARSEDFDPEWDVEYDDNSFEWVSIGHASPRGAQAAWTGSNPGCTTEVPYKGNAAACKRYDEMARDCLARRRARQCATR